ncbi:MAG: protein kinase, partial [Proteobacteria bacterium]|nr:protein kinase [Pseudomonadota bacterium]
MDLHSLMFGSPQLDELSTARLIGQLAGLVHAARTGGKPTELTPDKIVVTVDGTLRMDAAGGNAIAYSSPEKIKNVPTDRRSDVFSLGIVMWEALVHARLFDGNDDGVKTAMADQVLRSTVELNANIPAELDAICKKALARDPGDRYASPKVMAAEIETVLDDAGYPDDNARIATFMKDALARLAVNAPRAANGTTPPAAQNMKATTVGHAITPTLTITPTPAPAPTPTPLPSVKSSTIPPITRSTPPAGESPALHLKSTTTPPTGESPAIPKSTSTPPTGESAAMRPKAASLPPPRSGSPSHPPKTASAVTTLQGAPAVVVPTTPMTPAPPILPTTSTATSKPNRLDDMVEMVTTTPFERTSVEDVEPKNAAAQTLQGLALGPVPGSDEALASPPVAPVVAAPVVAAP